MALRVERSVKEHGWCSYRPCSFLLFHEFQAISEKNKDIWQIRVNSATHVYISRGTKVLF